MTENEETTEEEGAPEPTLAARQILGRELENALKQIKRPASGLFVSAVAAGLNVSFGALLMGMALTFSGGFESAFVTRFVLANISTVGFVIVIIGQTELFTAHTTLGVLPVMDRRASLAELGELWGVVLVGNLSAVRRLRVSSPSPGHRWGSSRPRQPGHSLARCWGCRGGRSS